MKILINIFGSLVAGLAVVLLASLEALVEFLALRVNWSLVFVLGFSALLIVTLINRKK